MKKVNAMPKKISPKVSKPSLPDEKMAVANSDVPPPKEESKPVHRQTIHWKNSSKTYPNRVCLMRKWQWQIAMCHHQKKRVSPCYRQTIHWKNSSKTYPNRVPKYQTQIFLVKENRLPQFGLCLNNDGYSASLKVGKVYRVIRNDDAAVHGYIRVIDESGEDYAYTTDHFHLIRLPIAVEKVLLSVS